MCLVLDQFLWGHSSHVCDISCCLSKHVIYVTEELPVSSTNLCRSLVKCAYQKNNFLISLQKTYVVGTQNEMVLLSTQNIC